jgi:hypothetical protein
MEKRGSDPIYKTDKETDYIHYKKIAIHFLSSESQIQKTGIWPF